MSVARLIVAIPRFADLSPPLLSTRVETHLFRRGKKFHFTWRPVYSYLFIVIVLFAPQKEENQKHRFLHFERERNREEKKSKKEKVHEREKVTSWDLSHVKNRFGIPGTDTNVERGGHAVLTSAPLDLATGSLPLRFMQKKKKR